MRVLIVEDERPLARALARGLEEEGFVVSTAADGDEGLWAATGGEFDVVVLDLMLPGKPGLQVCRELRRRGVRARVLMLTALDAPRDVATGLDAGADDYVRKPVAFEEFLARVRALARSPRTARSSRVRVAGLEIDFTKQAVSRDDGRVELTALEFRLLEYLAVHVGEPVQRARLTAALWDHDDEPDSNVLEVLVSALRRKLPELQARLVTVRGVGYRLDGPAVQCA